MQRGTTLGTIQGLLFAAIVSVLAGPAHAGSVEEGIPAGTANTCRSPSDGFMDFEYGVDSVVIESSIPGAEFTTTSGLNWVYGDIRTGSYNVNPYNDQNYETNGNVFAWLGTTGDIGRITFVGGPASYLSVLVSTASGLTLEAYNEAGVLLDSSGFASSNVDTGTLTRLTVEAADIAYVEIHDTGNFWLMDDLCTDAPSPCERVAGTDSGNPGDRVDLVFVPATDYGGDFATFRADVDTHIGRLLTHPPVDTAADKFNFYLTELEGTAGGLGGGGGCATLPADLLSQCPFADAVGVLHDGSLTDCTNFIGSVGVFGGEGHDATLRSFIHEGGHAMFRVADEYDDVGRGCVTAYDLGVENNIWSTEDDCRASVTANGGDPDQCYQFTTCDGGWFKLGDPTLASDADRYADPDYQYIMLDGTKFTNGWGDASSWRIETVLDGLALSAELPFPEPSGEQALLMTIRFDESGLTLLDSGFVVAPSPDYMSAEVSYLTRMIGTDGSVLGEFPLEDPRLVFGEEGPEYPTPRTSAEETIVLPYFFNIDHAQVIDTSTGVVGLTVDFSQFTSPAVGPIADADGPYGGEEGQVILLDASGSFQAGGTIVRYEWDLDGDGLVDVDTDQAMAEYTPGDNYSGPAYVRVTNADGLTAVAETTIDVTNVAPIADAGSNLFYFRNRAVQFEGSFVDPGVLDTHTITWDYGDGHVETGVGLEPIHNYRNAGRFVVTLTVEDDDGGVDSDRLFLRIRGGSRDSNGSVVRNLSQRRRR